MNCDRGVSDIELDRFILEALFTTVININFDTNKVSAFIDKAYLPKEKARKTYEAACAAKN